MRPEFNKPESELGMDAQLVSLADKSDISRQAVQSEEIPVAVRKINHNRGHKVKVIRVVQAITSRETIIEAFRRKIAEIKD